MQSTEKEKAQFDGFIDGSGKDGQQIAITEGAGGNEFLENKMGMKKKQSQQHHGGNALEQPGQAGKRITGNIRS